MTETDQDGRFELEGLPDEPLGLEVHREGYAAFKGSRRRSVKVEGENAIVLKPVGAMVGRVVDEQTGQPVRAFNVKLDFPRGLDPREELDETFSRDYLGPNETFPFRLTQPGLVCRTQDGSFRIGGLIFRVAYSVLVSAEGYTPSRVDGVLARAPEDETPPAVIRLEKGTPLSGRVLDAETGRGVASAEVFLAASPRPHDENQFGWWYLKECRKPWFWVEKTVTGQDGGFEFPHAATWGHLAVAVRSAGHAIRLAKIPDRAKPVAIRLERGGVIEGTAKGAYYQQLEGAETEGFDFGGTPLSEEGSFRLEGLPAGEWTLTLMDSQHYVARAKVRVAAGQTARFDFANPPGFKVSGRVTRGGAPCPGVEVQVNSATQWLAHRRTDDQGRYTVPGLSPGAIKVEVGGGYSSEDTAWATVVDKDLSLDFAFPTGRIEGRVLDAATGKPVAEAPVHALRLEGPDAPPERVLLLRKADTGPDFADDSISKADPRVVGLRAARTIALTHFSERGSGASTKSEGEFAIERLPPGDYALYVDRGGSSIPAMVAGIRVEADGAIAKCEARLDHDAAFRLKVTDSETRGPIADARITVCTALGERLADSRWVPKRGLTKRRTPEDDDLTEEPFKTDREGIFGLAELARTDYGVWVIAPGYGARFVAPVPAKAQNPPPETLIALERTGTLVLKAPPDLLKGLPNPYLAYRIRDAAGRAVCPGGKVDKMPPYETGVGQLFGAAAPELRINTIPPGRYTLEWEIHQLPETEAETGPRVLPAAHHGKAEIEIRKGQETIVPLAPAP